MPTAAKAFSALALMGLVWLISVYLITPRFPEGFNPGRFAQVNAVVAFVTGWRVIGARAGYGIGPAIGQGITAGVVIVACAGLFHAAYQMIEYSLRGRYGDPLSALLDILRIFLDDLQMVLHLPIFIALGAGCLAVAVLAEQLSRVAR